MCKNTLLPVFIILVASFLNLGTARSEIAISNSAEAISKRVGHQIFMDIAPRVLANTRAAQALYQNLGKQRFGELLSHAIKQHWPHYQQAWERNIAVAWQQSLSQADLDILATSIKPPADVSARLRAVSAQIGSLAQASNQVVMQAILKDILKTMIKEADNG